MNDKIKSFFENLIGQYSCRKDINYVFYNGKAKPYRVNVLPTFAMDSEEKRLNAMNWLADYFSNTLEINYYELYKQWIKDIYGLWVNPTLAELTAFNRENDLDAYTNITNIPYYESNWSRKLQHKLRNEFIVNGYMLLLGNELIEELVDLYDQDSHELTFVEWVKPIDLSAIENDKYYIVDCEVFTEPILFDNHLIIERDNQEFHIPSGHIKLYFDHLVVTKRGLTSQEIVEDSCIEFKFYKNLTQYIQCHSYEQKEKSLSKLFKDGVNPHMPFVEAITENFGEIYINTSSLKTEKDILDFVNLAYDFDEVDREAKSFNRKNILKNVLTNEQQKRANVQKFSINSSYKSLNSRNYSIK